MIRRPCTKCGSVDIPKKHYIVNSIKKKYKVITRICKACLKDLDADYRERPEIVKKRKEYNREYYLNNAEYLKKKRRINYEKQKGTKWITIH